METEIQDYIKGLKARVTFLEGMIARNVRNAVSTEARIDEIEKVIKDLEAMVDPKRTKYTSQLLMGK